MSKSFKLILAVCLLLPVALLHAQAPSGSTGKCKDGTYSTASSKDGACRGHKGIEAWYAASATPSKPALTSTTPKAASLLPAGPAPAGASGQCKDGTYSTAASKDGACRGHKGIGAWYAASATPSKPAVTSTAPKESSIPYAGPAPSGASGQCKDGTYSTAAGKDGACRGHQGVKTWFAATSPSPSKPPSAQSAPSAPASMPAVARPIPAVAPRQSAPASPMLNQTAAGGGNGQVWVNTSTKVYHCSGDRYYGKTKQGGYMSEADAKSKGFRPDAGKACH